MATATAQQPCIKCDKGKGIITCGGCQQWFCTKHLLEHRQELAIQKDAIGQEHDLLQRDLTEENVLHPLLSSINNWEQKSIKKIQDAAEEARNDLRKYLDHSKNQLKTSLIQVFTELQSSYELDDYTEIDLRKWTQQLNELREQLLQPSSIDMIDDDQTQAMIYSIKLKERQTTVEPVQETAEMTKPIRSLVNIRINDCWTQHGVTVAGGYGQGNALNQLYGPHGVYLNDDQTIYIADYDNHRIVQWKYDGSSGEVVAGGNGRGHQTDRLTYPTDVIVNKNTDSLIICDRDNRRIMQWPCRSGIRGETIMSNINCQGLMMDNEGFLYVSDSDKHEVRRYRMGETNGIVVAGGNGKGDRLNRLNFPTNIFVDCDHSVYVSDSNNNRVMKWMNGAKEGIVVAGGRGKGSGLKQLSNPRGVFVDSLGTVYVVDGWNHRVVRWYNEATHGDVIVGGYGQGEQANRLNYPESLTFDQYGNLYVTDCLNHRVQRFDLAAN